MNPTVTPSAWKTDNYKFVGKAFDYAYANYMNKLSPILGERNAKSVDYELTASGGYGELQPYDGNNLNIVEKKRGFKTIVTPEEFSSSVPLTKLQCMIDKSGECRKVGAVLGEATAMTVYLHVLRCLGGAFDPEKLGGDGQPWAPGGILAVTGKVGLLDVGADEAVVQLLQLLNGQIQHLGGGDAGDALAVVILNNVRHLAHQGHGDARAGEDGGSLDGLVHAVAQVQALVALAVGLGFDGMDADVLALTGLLGGQDVLDGVAGAAEGDDPVDGGNVPDKLTDLKLLFKGDEIQGSFFLRSVCKRHVRSFGCEHQGDGPAYSSCRSRYESRFSCQKSHFKVFLSGQI